MTVSNFIPNGRTSRVKKGEASLQIQTEYAYRPYPRLTTTITNNGQVVHKIEKKLDRPIGSFEEQTEIERLIKRQHADVLSIVEDYSAGQRNMLQVLKKSDSEYLSIVDRIKAIPGVRQVYELDIEGNFLRQENAEQFKRAFSVVFKGVRDLIEIFALVPGITVTREKGVYEIERDRLYLVSCGDEIYIVNVSRANDSIVYDQVMRRAVEDFFRE